MNPDIAARDNPSSRAEGGILRGCDDQNKLIDAAECLLHMQRDEAIPDIDFDRMPLSNDWDRRPGRAAFRPPAPPVNQDPGNARLLGSNKRPKVMPDHYDEKTSWTEYLGHFEICAELNEWSNLQKAQYLCVSLRGAAAQVLRSMPREQLHVYRDVVRALNRRFNPENQTELFRAQLKNRHQRQNESLPELAQELRRLVQLAYPTASLDILDVLGKDQFIDALDDSEIRWRVYQIKARTLDDAVCAAVEMEAYKKAESQRSHFRKPVRRLNCDDKTAAPDKSTDLNQLRSYLSWAKRQKHRLKPT